MEQFYYHPIFLQEIIRLRRINRNDDVALLFYQSVLRRKKREVMGIWKQYVVNRCQTRWMIVKASLKWRNDYCGRMFDVWRAVTVAQVCAVSMQRLVRGYLGRARKTFLVSINRRVVKVQASARQLQTRITFKRHNLKRRWAAIYIQRIARGMLCRRRVKSIVEAAYDTGKRLLEREKERWVQFCRFKATVCLQLLMRRCLVRRRIARRTKIAEMKDKWETEMEAMEEQLRVNQLVHRLELERWFIKRKQDYEKTRLDEERNEDTRRRFLPCARTVSWKK